MSQPQLVRALKVRDGVALLIGITIGSGIYATPGLIANYFSSFSTIFLTWVLVGGFVLIGGLIYSELGTRMPQTGGEYRYITRAFGPFAGFMFGWAQLFIIRTSPAAGLALVAADYLSVFIEMSRTEQMWVAAGIILMLGAFNYVGIRWANMFQNISTWLKVLGLLLFAVGGFLLLKNTPNLLGTVSAPPSELGSLGNLAAALMLVVFSFMGWDRVGYVAEEMKDPRKVIPRSMVIGMLSILVIYLAVITVYHYSLGMDGIRATSTPAADSATMMIGAYGGGFIALIAIISALGSINGTMMSASRVYYAMANDGLFFKWLDHIHHRFRVPGRAIIAHCAWGLVILVVRGNFASIAAGMVFAVLIFYFMMALSLFKLRREKVGEESSYKMPLFPILPIIYLIGIALLVIFRAYNEWQASLKDIAFVATGLPFAWYFLRKRRKAELA
jgi:APA family basic amino acid/polyamine antiporter